MLSVCLWLPLMAFTDDCRLSALRKGTQCSRDDTVAQGRTRKSGSCNLRLTQLPLLSLSCTRHWSDVDLQCMSGPEVDASALRDGKTARRAPIRCRSSRRPVPGRGRRQLDPSSPRTRSHRRGGDAVPTAHRERRGFGRSWDVRRDPGR